MVYYFVFLQMTETFKTYFIYVGKSYVGTMYARTKYEAASKFYHKDLKHNASCYKAYLKLKTKKICGIL